MFPKSSDSSLLIGAIYCLQCTQWSHPSLWIVSAPWEKCIHSHCQLPIQDSEFKTNFFDKRVIKDVQLNLVTPPHCNPLLPPLSLWLTAPTRRHITCGVYQWRAAISQRPSQEGGNPRDLFQSCQRMKHEGRRPNQPWEMNFRPFSSANQSSEMTAHWQGLE